MATALPLCLSFHPVKPAKKKKGNAKSVVCQKVSLISRFTIESQRKVRRRGVCVCVCDERGLYGFVFFYALRTY